MAANNGRVVNKTTTIDNVSWTAIIAPIDCNNVNIVNAVVGGGMAVGLKIRTDSANAGTEALTLPGQQSLFGGPFTPRHNDNNRFRFLTGDVVAYAQLASGSYAVLQTYS